MIGMGHLTIIVRDPLYEKQANFNSFILRMFVQYIDLINIAKYLLLFFTKLFEPALKKKLENARMNNSAGFSCQVFGFCPRGELIISYKIYSSPIF